MMTLFANLVVLHAAVLFTAPRDTRWLQADWEHPVAEEVVCVFFVPTVVVPPSDTATRWDDLGKDLRDRLKELPVQANSGFT